MRTTIVSFRLGGEINISQEPLTRASSNDLYGLNVYQSTRTVTESDPTACTKYAYGYFDDLGSTTLKLAKNNYYHFELVCIPDGKSQVYQYPDGHYANPFECIFSDSPENGTINTVMYSMQNSLSMLGMGATQAKGITDDYRIQSNWFNTIERYQGILYNFRPSDDAKSVNINLYRMMVGIKLIIDDFTEGSVSVASTYGQEHTVGPAQGSTTNTLDVVVEMLLMPTILDALVSRKINNEPPFDEEQSGALYIIYTDRNGDDIVLYANGDFTYKRLTRHVLRFSLSDAIVNDGITPNFKDDPNGDLPESAWTW